jgi:hypothetical protein
MTRRNALNHCVVAFRCCSAPGQLRSGASPRSSRALGPMMLSPTLGRQRSDCLPFRHELPAQYLHARALSILKLWPCIPTWTCTWLPEQTFSAVITPSSILDFARGKNEKLLISEYVYIYVCRVILLHILVSHCIALSCPKHGSIVKYSFSSCTQFFFIFYLPRWHLTLEFFESSYLEFFLKEKSYMYITISSEF